MTLTYSSSAERSGARGRMRTALTVALAVPLTLASLAATARPAGAETGDPWVRAWGLNGVGQLGNGTTLNQQTPGSVAGIARNEVRELAAGGGNDNNPFALVLLEDGTVKSWGANVDGQLGNGTTTSQSFPSAVSAISGASDVAAGVNFGLAVRNGRVLSWGRNTSGQLGNGITAPGTDGPVSLPVAVQSLAGVKDVAAGCYHAVALREDGTVWTWGANSQGQLGIGSTIDQNTPKKVQGLEDIVAVSAGCYHGVALSAAGTVKTWGRNVDGQLGNDSTSESRIPVDVHKLEGVSAVFAGGYHNFAILDDGTVSAWGGNWAGQLGDGTTTLRTTPVPLPHLVGVESMAGGYNHTLAVLDDQSVLAWGDNSAGQLGDGTTTASLAPVRSLPAGSGTTRAATSTVWKSSYAY
ncbi:RCC1 domain-containing protein [Streptomyces sp. NPDC057445]|uniref:RCC1 domain-containing protein n=1 Tax=Streptomyces sp. NPDC057445 TaxID=3346136 RepID=UPI0036C6EF17